MNGYELSRLPVFTTPVSFAGCLHLMPVEEQLLEPDPMFALGSSPFRRQLIVLRTFHLHYARSVILAHVWTQHSVQHIQCALALAVSQVRVAAVHGFRNTVQHVNQLFLFCFS